jgi:hypothetical protein
MKKFFSLIGRGLSRLTPDKSDSLLFLGLGFIFYGVYQWHLPSAFVITGILLIAISFISLLPKRAS